MTLSTGRVLPTALLLVTCVSAYAVGQEDKPAAAASKPGSNLVVNGSFEQRSEGDPSAGIESLSTKDKVLVGWQIIESKRPSDGKDEAPGISNVDWIGPERWTASHGKHCLDLDGGIRQVVTTKPGQRYVLQFDLAGNPEVGVTAQHLRVTVGQETQRFDFDATGTTKRKLGWVTKRVTFTADGDRTALVFVNAEPNGYSAGVALDNVVIRATDDAGPILRKAFHEPAQRATGSSHAADLRLPPAQPALPVQRLRLTQGHRPQVTPPAFGILLNRFTIFQFAGPLGQLPAPASENRQLSRPRAASAVRAVCSMPR